MSVLTKKRRALLALPAFAGLGLLSAARPVHAMMAGQAPDTPTSRVDPNSAISPWTGAVSVVANGSPYSGTVISPIHVITAAHVLGGATAATVSCTFNLTSTPQSIGVTQIAIYPGSSFPYDDLAILTLSQPVPAGTQVYPIVDTAQPTGTVLALVGYGGSGNGNVGPTIGASATVKRSGRNVLDRLTDKVDASGRSAAFYVMDFDGPSGNGALGGPTLGNSIETGVASGDSGSGAFVLSGGVYGLYGVNNASLGFQAGGATLGQFGSGAAGLVLSHPPYLQWITQQTNGTIELLSKPRDGDVPLPLWASGVLACGLAAGLIRHQRSRRQES